MKNHHPVGNLCKRFTAFTFLTGSLALSTQAYSQTASCPDLLAHAMGLQNTYMYMYGMCLKYPSTKCIKDVVRRQKLYEDALEAYKACNK